LPGTRTEVIDTVGEYRRAGADIVNMVFRHTIDRDAYEAFIEEVLPHFQKTS
jgi:alkanesulfonate monooxygenase SsuD/methylene tetrahydromethanopterin reductase-like flavin-dependent oxidoreductase (luciferase family)